MKKRANIVLAVFLAMVFQAVSATPEASAESRRKREHREYRAPHHNHYYRHSHRYNRPVYPFYPAPAYRVWPYEAPAVYLPPAYPTLQPVYPTQTLEPGNVLESLRAGTYITTWGLMTVHPAWQNQDGLPCRDFQAEALSGVACRGPDGIWRITRR